MSSDLINEYEAARLTGLSPWLLRWLTKYAVKLNDDRKLKRAKLQDGLMYFEKAELLDYNAWLKAPWPHKAGKRPGLPKGIREEVRIEANAQCAVCTLHGDACEAAHLDPVATSKNNHPHNLVWLCANHHTKFDNGALGPTKDARHIARAMKQGLHAFRRIQWTAQANLTQKLFELLEQCGKLIKNLEAIHDVAKAKPLARLAKKTIALLPSLAPAPTEEAYGAYKKLAHGLGLPAAVKRKKTSAKKGVKKAKAKAAPKRLPLVAQLKLADSFKEEIRLAAGLAECPLCRGHGQFEGYDCPACGASGVVDEADADMDLSPFRRTDCPVCEGTGRHRGHDCPECGGDGKMQARHAELVDLSNYDEVDCPACSGTGFIRGEECPRCDGDRKMERRFADRINPDDFKLTSCPLCKGKRHHRGNECPVCGGSGEVDNVFADNFDSTPYQLVKCPACKGKGESSYGECTTCGGEKRIEQRHAAALYER